MLSYAEAVQVLLQGAAGAAVSTPASNNRSDAERFAQRSQFFASLAGDFIHGVQIVHVAGSKGKGSVCELLRAAAVASGSSSSRVGTFTSPHLHTLRERIRIGDDLIPPADTARLTDR